MLSAEMMTLTVQNVSSHARVAQCYVIMSLTMRIRDVDRVKPEAVVVFVVAVIEVVVQQAM